MKEFQLKKNYNSPIYPTDSKLHSGKGFVNIDDRSQGGSHWTFFIVKDNKSFHFDSFGGAPDKFLLQLLKPIIYQNYRIQDINSNLCGSYCLYIFYLIERMKFFHTILKLVFEKIFLFKNAYQCFWKIFKQF